MNKEHLSFGSFGEWWKNVRHILESFTPMNAAWAGWEFRDKQMREELMSLRNTLFNIENSPVIPSIKGFDQEALEHEIKVAYYCRDKAESELAQERAARTEIEAKCAEMRDAGEEMAGMYARDSGPLKWSIVKWKDLMNSSCGKGWASPELVKEVIEALKGLTEEFADVMYSEFQTTTNREPELKYDSYLKAQKVLSALTALNDKEAREA